MEELLGAALVGLGDGFVALTTCHTNFFPIFTHLREAVADLATVPTLAHALPGDLAVVAEKARGAENTAIADTKEVSTSKALLREVVIRKTVPPSEC